MDLPEPGERMNVDFKAAKGTLAFVTNVPSSDGSCSSGHSWLNYVDMVSGCQVSGSDKSGDVLDTASLAVGLGIVDAGSSGSSKLKAFGLSALAQVKVKDIPWSTPIPVGKRVSWRELFN